MEDPLDVAWRALEERRCFEMLNKRCSYCNREITDVQECVCWKPHMADSKKLDSRHSEHSKEIFASLSSKYPNLFGA